MVAAVNPDPLSLDSLSRADLVERARAVGVARPEVLTRIELKDEILRLTATEESERRQVRGWLGVARDLVASVMEDGLHMPDAAAFFRKHVPMTSVVPQPPVPTVTLAEIYASQGHGRRALKMLEEVLKNEPDHMAALKLRDKLLSKLEFSPEITDAEEVEEETPEAPELPSEEAFAPAVSGPAEVSAEARAPQEACGEAGAGSEAVAPELDAVAPEAGGYCGRPADAPQDGVESCLLLYMRGSTGVSFYWEVPPDDLAGADVRVRVIEMIPEPFAPRRVQRELPVETVRGNVQIEPTPEATVLRAAVGVTRNDAWTPLAVGVEVLPGVSGCRGGFGWLPIDLSDVDHLPAQLERARERALRSFGV